MTAVVRNEELCESIRRKLGYTSTKNLKQIYVQLPSPRRRKSNLKVAAYNLVANLRIETTAERVISHKDSTAHDDQARSFRSSGLPMADPLAQV
jgi:hypothetical protein